MVQKRGETRYDVQWPVSAGHRHVGNVQNRTINVSISGALFLSHASYQPQDMAELKIHLSRRETVSCIVRVVRQVSVAGGQYAVGVEFVQFFGDGRALLNSKLLELKRSQWDEACAGAR